jgi:hypothetical protein
MERHSKMKAKVLMGPGVCECGKERILLLTSYMCPDDCTNNPKTNLPAFAYDIDGCYVTEDWFNILTDPNRKWYPGTYTFSTHKNVNRYHFKRIEAVDLGPLGTMWIDEGSYFYVTFTIGDDGIGPLFKSYKE